MTADSSRKLSVLDFRDFKRRGEPIAMVTCYDYPTALLADRADIDAILVGDSIGNNVLGYDSTLPVTMDEMATHCRAVTRAAGRAFVIGDMPYMSYQPSERDAILNAGRLMSEGGVDAVKLEGAAAVAGTIRALVRSGIPVMGHIGLTPQSAAALGGYRVQGRDASTAARLLEEAGTLEDAGVLAIVLEAVPSAVAELITARVSVPTIGIGAGVHCDGQVLIFHDMFGLNPGHVPRFVKQYADVGAVLSEGFARYCEDVKARGFPTAEHSYRLKPEEKAALQALMAGSKE